MIDFTNMPKKNKTYTGANGSKISVLYNGELYMLKFPPLPKANRDMSYANSCISEYIGCKIYESIGIPVQDVKLGTYTTEKGKEKVVVACKDFAINGMVLQDFASLKNQVIDSENNGYGTELNDIIATFDYQTSINRNELAERFWDMFIVDSFIGNWDRHNGNWGFLYNSQTDEISLAPVFDCGSSLYPQADEDMMKKVISNQGEINTRVYNRPTSAIMINNERINYFNFISSHENKECNAALKRIINRIDMAKINNIIEETPYITDTHKQFLKTLLEARKEKILDFTYNKIRKAEKTKDVER